MYKGWALEKLNREVEALECYNQGVEKNSADPSLIWARGILLEKLGNVHESLADYRRTIEIGTNLPGVGKGCFENVKKYLDRLEETTK